jgi:predicted nuclease of predicted toxin-antitoxin system
MKLLLDANLSWRSVPVLAQCFGECAHVNTVGLPLPPSDSQIWEYATKNNFSIVTQDTDFLNFLETGGYPPKLILLRTGNISRQEAETILIKAKPLIVELHQKELGLLEII